MKLKTIFMGTPDYVLPSLQTLYEHSDICAVFTGQDKVGGRGKKVIVPKPKQFAQEHNIPLFQPKTFKDNQIIEKINSFDYDLLIVNAYGFILPDAILATPKLAPVNLHGSLLPHYRGASPIQSSLLHGDKETGITAQIMTKELDAGDIIHIVKTAIKDDDDYVSLSARLSKLSAQCLEEVLELFAADKVVKTPQNSAEAGFCKKIKKEHGVINWQDPCQTILQKIKAYIYWPQSYTYYNDMKIIIHKIECLDTAADNVAGTIIQADKRGLIIQCGQGLAKIINLQPQGKKIMDYRSFLNGYRCQINEKFHSAADH